jgi:hypothetical protein
VTRVPARRPQVSALVPTFAIDRKLGSVHVGTSFADVETMIREQVKVARETFGKANQWTRTIEEQTVRYALYRHAWNRAEYQQVMACDRRPCSAIVREMAAAAH